MRGLRPPDLLRERDFRRFWTGQTVSLLGDQVSLLAIPLTGVLVLHASPTEMGYLLAAGTAPSLLLSVYAGAWLDRRGRRRRHMIAADLGRAGLLATVPVALWLGRLTLAQLFTVAFAIGALDVVFFVAYSSLFVSLVRRDRFLAGQALLNGSRGGAQVCGQSLGGALVSILTAPVALLVDAVSFLWSAASLACIHPQEAPASGARAGRLADGARFIARSPVARRLLGCSATLNYFNYIYQALFVIFAVRDLDVMPTALGLVLGTGATGALLGSLVTPALVRRLGMGVTYAVACVMFPAPLLLVPLAPAATSLTYALLCAAEFGSGIGVMLYDITGGSMQAAVIPSTVRSRVAGAYRMVNYGVRPLGALSGGFLGSVLGLRPALWIGAAGALVCLTWVLRSPVIRLHDINDAAPHLSTLGPSHDSLPPPTAAV